MELLKVSSRSSPNSVAGALAGVVRQFGTAHIQVIGAGALNQAIKAVAIARGYVAPSGIDLVCVPTFADVEIDGESRTAIRLTVENRDPHAMLEVAGDGEIHLDAEATPAGPASSDGAPADGASADGAPADGDRAGELLAASPEIASEVPDGELDLTKTHR